MNEFKQYIGDGAYVRYDGYHVWLYTTYGGDTPTNEVALEPTVLKQFEEWLVRLRATLVAERKAAAAAKGGE